MNRPTTTAPISKEIVNYYNDILFEKRKPYAWMNEKGKIEIAYLTNEQIEKRKIWSN